MTYHRGCNLITTTGASNGAGTAYPFGVHEFITDFSGVRVTLSLVLCVMFYRPLFVLLSFLAWPLCWLSFFDLRILLTHLLSITFCLGLCRSLFVLFAFSIGHCFVCPFLLVIVLSVLRFTASDYLFDICKLLSLE